MIIKINIVQLTRNIQTNFDGGILVKYFISYNVVIILLALINLVQVMRF
jgi:hypothetical protein